MFATDNLSNIVTDMSDKHRVIPAVCMVVYDDDKVLLHRRINTGYRDGWYAPPGGHVEQDETVLEAAPRELREETGLIAKPEDFELFHIVTNDFETPGSPYLYLFCKIALKKCSGHYSITEPDKCDDMDMFPMNALPEKTPDYVRVVVAHLGSSAVTFSKIAP
jgi:8-oxo-dGTP diphosphatase